jgi:hypothetical protein
MTAGEMAQDKLQKSSPGPSFGQAAKKRFSVPLAALFLILLATAAGAYWLFAGKQGSGQPTLGSVARDASQEAKRFDRLKGRWVRPDGGYVLEIRDIAADGQITAGYFNPRPINISRAIAAEDGKTLKVFLELRDVNYPGATYNLSFNPEKDQLQGIYQQPVLQQSFPIFFVRVK